MDMISGLRYEAERLRKLQEAEEAAKKAAEAEAATDAVAAPDVHDTAPPASE